jgi:hypothetical protein
MHAVSRNFHDYIKNISIIILIFLYFALLRVLGAAGYINDAARQKIRLVVPVLQRVG